MELAGRHPLCLPAGAGHAPAGPDSRRAKIQANCIIRLSCTLPFIRASAAMSLQGTAAQL